MAMGPSSIQNGVTIDGFLVGPLVHRGGMAALWQVTRPGIDMPLLMKVPRLLEGEDPAAIVSFEMEQMILPRLADPHVPKFIAAGDFSKQPYIVMERVPGPSLLDRLEDLPLPYAEVAALGARIATALDEIHRQHVIHLDVKPSNVLFRPGGEAVLIDFGLSRHDQLPDLMEEEFRLPYGTAPYMAPEQITGNRRDPRSDFFSLGALMYFFATGVRPFGESERLKHMQRRLWRDPIPPRQRRLDFPPWLQEIILRCLEVNPAWRYPTGAQLAFDLRHAEQVKLTARADRVRQDAYFTALRRKFNPEPVPAPRAVPVANQIAAAPIIVVAIDLAESAAPLAELLRETARRLLGTLPSARIACLNVLKQSRIALYTTLDEEGRNKHVLRLAELKHWAAPLQLAEGRVTYHVLEATDPAEAILDYARANYVDHIIMGARANSMMRSLLGGVSAAVAGKAPCTVTVVRPRGAGEK